MGGGKSEKKTYPSGKTKKAHEMAQKGNRKKPPAPKGTRAKGGDVGGVEGRFFKLLRAVKKKRKKKKEKKK